MEQENRPKGGEAYAVYAERVDLRADLLAKLREPGVRKDMTDALVREATEGNKSGSVLRAYELVREIVGTDGEALTGQEPDFSRLSDRELRAMIAELETERQGEDGEEGGRGQAGHCTADSV